MKIKRIVAYLMLILAMTFVVPMPSVTVETKAATAYLNYAKCSMTVGYTVKLQVKGTSSTVKWSTTNKKVATVKNGKVTGKGPGNCTIIAKVNGQKLKCQVTVVGTVINKKKNFKSTTLDVLELKLDVNTVTYSDDGSSQVKDEDGTFTLAVLNKPKNKKVKWSSSNKSVAKVKKGKVTAVKKGKCTITAKVGKKKYKCKVVVTNLNNASKIAAQENIYTMLKLMNKDRVKAKVAPLKIKESINKVANIRAKEIPEAFSHTRPDGTSYKTAYTDAGVKIGALIGENVAYTADKVDYIDNFVNIAYDSLYKSPTHKSNMLDPGYEYIGIGYYNAGTYYDEYGALFVKTYWVQNFYTK